MVSHVLPDRFSESRRQMLLTVPGIEIVSLLSPQMVSLKKPKEILPKLLDMCDILKISVLSQYL